MRIVLLVNQNIETKYHLGFKPNVVYYFDEQNWKSVFEKACNHLSNSKTIVLDEDGFLPFLFFSKQKNVCVSYPLNDEMARLSVEHNNAQVMVLPLNFIPRKYIRRSCISFLRYSFEGGRHQTRIDIMHKPWKNTTKPTRFTGQRIIVASDHAGYRLKQKVIEHLVAKKYKVIDAGTNSENSTAYSVHAIALGLNAKHAKLGIAICGSGIGIANTINKFKALNCCVCFLPRCAHLARQEYGANVLALGQRFISDDLALKVVDRFLVTKPNQNFKEINSLGFAYDSKRFSNMAIDPDIKVPSCLK